jgi:opacity protein-like surface antigen
MKRKMFLAAASSLVLAVTTFAADVSGKWTAEVSGPNGQTQTTTFVFKVEGEKLTGTVSGRAGENPISDGTVKGEDLAFNVALRFNGNDMKLIYKGKVEGEEIKMARRREGFTGPAQQFTARRANE